MGRVFGNGPGSILGKNPSPNEFLEYDTKLHLMVRIQSWSSRKCRVPLHCYYYQVYSEPEVAVPAKVSSMGEIELFNHIAVNKQMTDIKLNC